jgi:hypothetical protein
VGNKSYSKVKERLDIIMPKHFFLLILVIGLIPAKKEKKILKPVYFWGKIYLDLSTQN